MKAQILSGFVTELIESTEEESNNEMALWHLYVDGGNRALWSGSWNGSERTNESCVGDIL